MVGALETRVVNCGCATPLSTGVTFTDEGRTFPLATVSVMKLSLVVNGAVGAGDPPISHPFAEPRSQVYAIEQASVADVLTVKVCVGVAVQVTGSVIGLIVNAGLLLFIGTVLI